MADSSWPSMDIFRRIPAGMVDPDHAITGSDSPVNPAPAPHQVLGTSLTGPISATHEVIYLAMGCFWGVEKLFWDLPGVVNTAVGYQGGYTRNPTYEQVCSGMTGHTETVRVIFDPQQTSLDELLRRFWENHDPTQGFRQGNDVGSQYRSAIFWTTEQQRDAANSSQQTFATRLKDAGYGQITTQVSPVAEVGPFYLAEDYHQQYLVKNPGGYCPIHATGVRCG